MLLLLLLLLVVSLPLPLLLLLLPLLLLLLPPFPPVQQEVAHLDPVSASDLSTARGEFLERELSHVAITDVENNVRQSVQPGWLV